VQEQFGDVHPRLLINDTGIRSEISRPLSRARVILTKYGVAVALSLALCILCGVLAVVAGARQGVAIPSVVGLLESITLLWLGMLFVIGLATLYSVLVPNALAAGTMAFITTNVLAIAPDFHSGASAHVSYALGGPDWSIATYMSSLGVYTDAVGPLKSLVVLLVAALIPVAAACAVFARRAF
jgi:ABC-2 type transport system permease protein